MPLLLGAVLTLAVSEATPPPTPNPPSLYCFPNLSSLLEAVPLQSHSLLRATLGKYLGGGGGVHPSNHLVVLTLPDCGFPALFLIHPHQMCMGLCQIQTDGAA